MTQATNVPHLQIVLGLVLASLFFCVSVTVSPTFAQTAAESAETEPYDLSVSPATAYLKLRPGNKAVHTITLKNNGSEELLVTPRLVDFTTDGKTGLPVLTPNTSFPYLDMDRTSFEPLTLPGKATAQLTLHFNVPSTAENREYPLTILFSGRSEPDSEVVTQLSGVIGSNIIALVSDTDELTQRFSVEDFGTGPVVDSLGKIVFTPTIKNNSYAAAVASGSATLTDWRGTKVAQYQLKPEVILGYSTRQIEQLLESESGENVDINESFSNFEYDHPFMIGPYKLTITFSSSADEQTPATETHTIWAIPISLVIAAVVASLGLAAHYYYKRQTSYF